MQIIKVTGGECIDYAAEELKKYIVAMSSGAILPTIVHNGEAKTAGDGEILLGLLEELSLDSSDVADAMIDDVIDVKIKNLSGYIAGSNPRSVLMGVYRYCESAGVRYIRPGEDGDYIPECDLTSHSFELRKKADYPFRGECSEGAVSYEHMRDTVYFMPKIGMNMFMIEGVVPYTYMHKWYGHVFNSKRRIPGQVTDYAMLKRYIGRLERDIKRVGLQLHTLGHGWMFENMGIHDCDTATMKTQEAALPEKYKNLLAEVNGTRGLYGNSTFYTHFCYSNPEARKMLVDFMVDYSVRKPHVDFVHMWLADAANNQCECEECRKREPSDWYVMMLNELDERLTEKGLDTKIVFIAYVDTVRPPRELRLNNPGRFILLTAIGGFYEEGYKNEECTEELPPYERNSKNWSLSVPLRMQCHRDWKALCNDIPSIVYEYRYYCDMYCDISQMKIARETYRDMKALRDVSFNGCMSDQSARYFMPTSLPLTVMGKTLFDRDTDLDELKDDHFIAAYGKDGALVEDYLEGLTPLLSPSNFRVGGSAGIEEAGLETLPANKRPWVNNPAVAENAAKIPAYVDAFLPTVERGINEAATPAHRLSWTYLKLHGDIVKYHGRILKAGAEGNMDLAKEIFNELRDFLSEREEEFHNVFDLFLYLRAVSQKIGVKTPGYYD